jgi:dCMP deaminase
MSADWMERYFRIAKEVSTWSKDPSTRVGAIVVGKYGQILTQGFNGFPRGINDDPMLLMDREAKLKRMIHAEMNCIFNGSLSGVSLAGSTMYVYGMPVCSGCALSIIQSGIHGVHAMFDGESERAKRWQDSHELTKSLLLEAGVYYYGWPLR